MVSNSLLTFFWSFSFASYVLGCSSCVVFESLVLDGVMLLLVVLSIFLPCLPIIFSDWHSWGHVSDDYSSRCQRIQGTDACSLWWSWDPVFSHPRHHFVFLEVSWHSQSLLCNPGGCLVLFPWKLLTQAWSHGCGCLGPALEEVIGSGLLQWKLLTQASFSWLRSLVWAYSGKVTDLGQIPQRLLAQPGSTVVTGSGLLSRRLLSCTCACRGHWLGPVSFPPFLW